MLLFLLWTLCTPRWCVHCVLCGEVVFLHFKDGMVSPRRSLRAACSIGRWPTIWEAETDASLAQTEDILAEHRRPSPLTMSRADDVLPRILSSQ